MNERSIERVVVEKIVEVERIVYVQDEASARHCSLIELFSGLIAGKLEVKEKACRTQGRCWTL